LPPSHRANAGNLPPVDVPTLAEINALPPGALVGLLGGVFERSPWVAEAAVAARPFATVEALHAAMVQIVRRAPRAAQMMLLRAHPDLAGKEAKAGELTEASLAEQKSAALDRLSRSEMDTISRSNATYRARYGFPFIICVRNHDKAGIFTAIAQRLGHAPEVEFAAALDEVYQIARLRLEKLVEA
jgi:2-oxo-4-hydroxy-4-carboxy-5-ureidoimidazoline decarboxylase